jgi:hypothetical protein
MAQLEGAFPEVIMSQEQPFGRDVPVRLVREKRLGTTDLEYHAQHKKAAPYHYNTSLLCGQGFSWPLLRRHQHARRCLA